MMLFFAFGFCTVLVDTLVPKLKGLFALNYAEAMLTQFCFFGAYFIVSLPAARLIRQLGYLESVTMGLVIMAAGCLAFTPAAEHGSYPAFLAALFVLATGVTIVQVAANPLAARVGDPRHAHSRLTLAQAFNSLATAIGPLFGAAFILSDEGAAPIASGLSAAAQRLEAGRSVQLPFLMIGLTLGLLAAICWACRRWAPASNDEAQGGSYLALLRRPRLMLGVLGIFLYVGAEVAIGSMLVNYLVQASVLGTSISTAGSLVSVYWGLAMVGRFIGAGLLKRGRPGLLLAGCATAAGVLAMISLSTTGYVAAASILAIGLCNSIMFPTIFTLALEGSAEQAPRASGLLCLAIVGGAIIPVIVGAVADHSSLATALWVPVLCYAGIGAYGIYASKS
ncbi:glucose/galactose MFS transporter [Pseudoduganella sp. FT93W]|uniref:Glucose/galactose MFS transporter n=2 Tax=Duganella fentianensis TaxID=2692177 RepID=A0A845HXH0_9BURK|nr:glucose/galactose MFS transporter [Duganella fentianensis]